MRCSGNQLRLTQPEHPIGTGPHSFQDSQIVCDFRFLYDPNQIGMQLTCQNRWIPRRDVAALNAVPKSSFQVTTFPLADLLSHFSDAFVLCAQLASKRNEGTSEQSADSLEALFLVLIYVIKIRIKSFKRSLLHRKDPIQCSPELVPVILVGRDR